MRTLRAAVVGVGYFGAFHAEKYAELPGVELVAVVDADAARAAEVASRLGARACATLAELSGPVDLASIAVPTAAHASVAAALIDRGVHVLIEKPMVRTLEEADALIAASRAKGVLLQVGHLERFNGALTAVRDRIVAPMFIESHRLAPFKPRSTDVDIVMDVMIHDLDLILDLVPSTVRDVRANGIPVLTDHVDIAHARLEFENGCVANVTASRVSIKSMRKTRLFERDCYLSIDLQSGEVTIAARRAGASPIPGMRSWPRSARSSRRCAQGGRRPSAATTGGARSRSRWRSAGASPRARRHEPRRAAPRGSSRARSGREGKPLSAAGPPQGAHPERAFGARVAR
jgi:predicted dehydrogenase